MEERNGHKPDCFCRILSIVGNGINGRIHVTDSLADRMDSTSICMAIENDIVYSGYRKRFACSYSEYWYTTLIQTETVYFGDNHYETAKTKAITCYRACRDLGP